MRATTITRTLASDLATAIATPLLLIACVTFVETHKRGCVSSMAKLERSFVLWWIATPLVASAICFLARLPWPALLSRIAALVVCMLCVSVALPNLDFGSADRSREKHALADMRVIAATLENERARTGSYPHLTSVLALQTYSGSHLPLIDPWREEYVVDSSPDAYVVASRGICGQTPLRISRSSRDTAIEIKSPLEP